MTVKLLSESKASYTFYVHFMTFHQGRSFSSSIENLTVKDSLDSSIDASLERPLINIFFNLTFFPVSGHFEPFHKVIFFLILMDIFARQYLFLGFYIHE